MQVTTPRRIAIEYSRQPSIPSSSKRCKFEYRDYRVSRIVRYLSAWGTLVTRLAVDNESSILDF